MHPPLRVLIRTVILVQVTLLRSNSVNNKWQDVSVAQSPPDVKGEAGIQVI